MEVPKVSNPWVREVNSVMMSDLQTLKRISAYVVKYMVVEDKKTEMHLDGPSKDFDPEPPDKVP